MELRYYWSTAPMVVYYGLASIIRRTKSITTTAAYPFVSAVFCSRRTVVSNPRSQGSVDRIQHDWLISSCYCGFSLNLWPFERCTKMCVYLFKNYLLHLIILRIGLNPWIYSSIDRFQHKRLIHWPFCMHLRFLVKNLWPDKFLLNSFDELFFKHLELRHIY